MTYSLGLLSHIPILKYIAVAVHVILKHPTSTTSPSTPAGSLHLAFPSVLETRAVQFNILNSKMKKKYFSIIQLLFPSTSTDQMPIS